MNTPPNDHLTHDRQMGTAPRPALEERAHADRRSSAVHSAPGTAMTRPGGEHGNGANGASGTSVPATSDGAPRGEHDLLRVTLVNDYELVVRGLHAMLAPYADRVVVVDDSTAERGDDDHLDGSADIALFDTFAARRDALQRAQSMIEEGTVEHIVLYTWDAPPDFVRQARDIGVAAVIPKTSTAEELVDALERVANGERVGLDDTVKGERSRVDGPELTVREQEVLALLALGLSNAEIAHELFLSVDTIKTHVRRVFSKLGVNNRTQAAMRVVTAQSGLHRPPVRSERSNADPPRGSD